MRGNLVCPLSELQAAALLPQIDKLQLYNERRANNVRTLIQLMHAIPGICPLAPAHSLSGYYKVGFQYDEGSFGLSRQRFVAALRAEGMAFDEGFRALHVGRSPSRFRRVGALAVADRAHHGAVVLHHPILLEPEAEVSAVATAVRKTYANAGRLVGA